MSDKKLNAIKEIEFRINLIKTEYIKGFSSPEESINSLCERFENIDNLLFDINDFINDLKDKDETNWKIKNAIEVGFKR